MTAGDASPVHGSQPMLAPPPHARSNARPGRVLPVLVAIAVLMCGGCAGYRFGNQSLYSHDIATVYVPIFESDSFRRHLGERLTEAVVKEVELKTPYKVVSTPNADTILSGRITHETKRVLIRNRFNDPREMEVNLQVQVRWLDRRGQVLREDSLALPEAATSVTGSATFVPEVGHSVATAQQQAIERLAQQIVALMEDAW